MSWARSFRRLRRIATGTLPTLCFWAAALGTMGPALGAQEHDSTEGRVMGVLRGSVSATQLAGQAGGLWGVGAGVWVGPVFVGGRGVAIPGALLLNEGPTQDSRLQFGYAGLNLGLRSWGRGGFEAIIDLLAGAGRAQLEDSVVRRELGADNFLAIEPAVRVRRGFAGGVLRTGVSMGYRQVWGVEDLPGLDASDLRGATITLSLSLERR